MTDTVLGVVILSRHGDRSGYYQSPVSYKSTATAITPLGETQEYQLGGVLRARYLDPASPRVISGINADLFSDTQVEIQADAGGEGSVIMDSANALAQGLYPPNTASNITLANGTVVVSPLNGWQYIAVESIEPEDSVALEGWTDCDTFTASNSALYESAGFKQVESEQSAFLQSLVPIVGNRPVTLANFYNVFDYVNVQSLHNSTFLASVNQQILNQTRALANYHEFSVFSSDNLGDIRNIAGQTVLPDLLSALDTFSNTSQPLKMLELSMSYKPFLSLFKMTNVSDTYPETQGIVDYASAVAFELRQPADGSELTVALSFKNGTQDFVDLNMFGNSGPTTWTTFNSTLAPYAINDLTSWCSACDNSKTRGCDVIYKANKDYGSKNVAPGQSVSPLAAGFIGAAVTLAVILASLLLLLSVGALRLGRGHRNNKAKAAAAEKGF